MAKTEQDVVLPKLKNQTELGQEENEVKWNSISGTVSPDPSYSVSKKFFKKLKKLKNVIFALYRANTDQDRPQKW